MIFPMQSYEFPKKRTLEAFQINCNKTKTFHFSPKNLFFVNKKIFFQIEIRYILIDLNLISLIKSSEQNAKFSFQSKVRTKKN